MRRFIYASLSDSAAVDVIPAEYTAKSLDEHMEGRSGRFPQTGALAKLVAFHYTRTAILNEQVFILHSVLHELVVVYLSRSEKYCNLSPRRLSAARDAIPIYQRRESYLILVIARIDDCTRRAQATRRALLQTTTTPTHSGRPSTLRQHHGE